MKLHHVVAAIGLIVCCRMSAAATWQEARFMMDELSAAGEYEAALKLEDEMLALVLNEFGTISPEFVDANLFSAAIHAYAGNGSDAQDRMRTAVQIAEDNTRLLTEPLILSFIELGMSYQDVGEHRTALDVFERAREFVRMELGLYDDFEVPLLELMSDSRVALGQYQRAISLRRTALINWLQANETDSPESLEVNYRFAEWLSSQSDYQGADTHYQLMTRIVQLEFDNDPWLMLNVLKSIADNRIRFRYLPDEDEDEPEQLEEAFLLAGLLAEPDPLLEAELLLQEADWNVVFDREDEIEDSYGLAWDALDGLAERDALRSEWFEQGGTIYSAPVDLPQISDPDVASVRLRAEFEIDVDGRARDIEIVESEPDGLLDREAVRYLEESRFRPRVRNGRPVRSSGYLDWNLATTDCTVDVDRNRVTAQLTRQCLTVSENALY